MSNKTVTINPNPRKKPEPDPAILDALVQGKALPTPTAPASSPAQEERQGRGAINKAQMKRLTFDIPADLHKRIRRTCLENDVDMAVELRRILQKHFPA